MSSPMPKITSPFSVWRRRKKSSTQEEESNNKHRNNSSNDVENIPIGTKVPGYCKASDTSNEPVHFESLNFHSSLSQALSNIPLVTPEELAAGVIPKTNGLTQSVGEKEYRAARQVHNSPIRTLSVELEERLYSVPQNPRKRRQLCCLAPCKFLRIPSHRENFLHICPMGERCGLYLQSDHEHCRFYSHLPEDQPQVTTQDAASLLPSISAARYQVNQPRTSWCPRGGFRPEGGCIDSTELRFLNSEKNRSDTALLLIKGINVNWDDEEFALFVQEHAGPGNLPIQTSLVFGQSKYSQNTGSGTVQMRSYAEARILKKALHRKEFANVPGSIVTVEYLNSIPRPADLVPSKENWLKSDPAILRFNQAIRDCGPYYCDAEAVFDRMKQEGHDPDPTTYTELLRCYRDARPPRPMRGVKLLEQMRSGGERIHTVACNLIVDACCRAGDMRRAEALVADMESESWLATQRDASLRGAAHDQWLQQYLPPPNNETYQILCDGWQRAGLLHTVADREGPFGLPGPGGPLHAAVGGVTATRAPAASILTSWARQRGGYMSKHTGLMHGGVPTAAQGAADLERDSEGPAGAGMLNKWRARN